MQSTQDNTIRCFRYFSRYCSM